MSLVLRAVKTGFWVGSALAPGLAGKVAFDLFCRLKSPVAVRPADAAVHAQAAVDHLVHTGRRIAFYQWGDGANPVLLVHGWESRGSRFALLVTELLARGFSPITFDAPGNGDSQGNRTTIVEYAEIIAELHERFGPFRAIVGHSFGALATFHALRAGVKADRVVSVCGVCDLDYLVDAFSDTLELNDRVRGDLRTRFAGLFPDEPDVYRRFSVPFEAQAVTMPVLVVQDDTDQRVSMGQAEKMAGAFAHAELVTTHGLGHSGILADPDTLRLIADFVAPSAD